MRYAVLPLLAIFLVVGPCWAEDEVNIDDQHLLVKRRHKRQIVNVWTAWSAWSRCSMTCNDGVRERQRGCVGRAVDRLVRLENPTCSGDAVEYQVCKERDCPPQSKEEREYQCEMKNHQQVFGHNYKWKPYNGVRDPCHLTCLAIDYSFYYNFGHVTDGTKCRKDVDDEMCVKGVCSRVGCDGRVNSDSVMDRCRICNGLNQNCMFWKGSFDVKFPTDNFGYTHVVTIPKGATYVEVTDKSKNFIALKTTGNNYIINGKYMIDSPGEYRMAGTNIKYNRTKYTEKIETEGPTRQELHVMVIFRDKNPGINYKFYLPQDQREKIVEPSPPPRHRPRTAFVPTPAPKRVPDNRDNIIKEKKTKTEFDFTSIFAKKEKSDENDYKESYKPAERHDFYEKLKKLQSKDKTFENKVPSVEEKYLETVEALYDRKLWENEVNRRQLKKPKPYKFRYTDSGAFSSLFQEGEDGERGEDNREPGEEDTYEQPDNYRQPDRYEQPEEPEPYDGYGEPSPYERYEEPTPYDPYQRPEPGIHTPARGRYNVDLEHPDDTQEEFYGPGEIRQRTPKPSKPSWNPFSGIDSLLGNDDNDEEQEARETDPRYRQTDRTDPRYTQTDRTDSRNRQTDRTDPRYTQTDRTDSRNRQPDRTDPRYTQTDRTDSRNRQPDRTDPRYTQTDRTNSRNRQTDRTDPRYTETDRTDSRNRQTDRTDPRYRQTGEQDPRYRQTDQTDPRYRPTDPTDTRYRQTGEADPRHRQTDQNHNQDHRRHHNRNEEPRCHACPPIPALGPEYCNHHFAVRGEVLSRKVIRNETRYEIQIRHTYRADFDMMSLEYLWYPGPCACPMLEPGYDYIIVGDMVSRQGRRESRLQVTSSSYIVSYSHAEEARVRAVSTMAGCDFL